MKKVGILLCLLLGCSFSQDSLRYQLLTEQEYIARLAWNLLTEHRQRSSGTLGQRKTLKALGSAFLFGLELHKKFLNLSHLEKTPVFSRWKYGYFHLSPHLLLKEENRKVLDEANLTPLQFLYWRNFLSLVQYHFLPWRKAILKWKSQMDRENRELPTKIHFDRSYYKQLDTHLAQFQKKLFQLKGNVWGEVEKRIKKLSEASFKDFDKVARESFSSSLYWALYAWKMQLWEQFRGKTRQELLIELEQWQKKMGRLFLFFLLGKGEKKLSARDFQQFAHLLLVATLLEFYPFQGFVLGRSPKNQKSYLARQLKTLFQKEYLPRVLPALFRQLVHSEQGTDLWPGFSPFLLAMHQGKQHLILQSRKGVYSFRYLRREEPSLFVSPYRLGDCLYVHFSLEFNPHFGYFGIQGWRRRKIQRAWERKDEAGNVQGDFGVATFLEAELLQDLGQRFSQLKGQTHWLVREMIRHFGFYRLASFRATVSIPKELLPAYGLISTTSQDSLLSLKGKIFTYRLFQIIRNYYGQASFATDFSQWKYRYEEERLEKKNLAEAKLVVRFLNDKPLLLYKLPQGKILYWCDRYRDLWAFSSAEMRTKLVLLENEFRQKLTRIFLEIKKSPEGKRIFGPEIIWLAFPGTRVHPISVREGILTWLRTYQLGNPRLQSISREFSTYEFSLSFLYARNREKLKKEFQKSLRFQRGFWLILPLLPSSAFEEDSFVFQAFLESYISSLLHFNLESVWKEPRERQVKEVVQDIFYISRQWSSRLLKAFRRLQRDLEVKSPGRGIQKSMEKFLESAFLSREFLKKTEDGFIPFSFLWAKRNIAPFTIFSRLLPKGKGFSLVIQKLSAQFRWKFILVKVVQNKWLPLSEKYFIPPTVLEENVLRVLPLPSQGKEVDEDFASLAPVFQWLRNPKGKVLYLLFLYRGKEGDRERYFLLWDLKGRDDWRKKPWDIHFNVEELWISRELHQAIQELLEKKRYNE